MPTLILAPLRGVTIHAFRLAAAPYLSAAHFTEAFTPFITANPGFDPLKDRELRNPSSEPLRLTPQFIGKDPAALRDCLIRIKDAGFTTADLNCGCPFPMVRNKGRGSGLLRTPDVLRALLDVACTEMGPGNFSIKTRLGIERPDELAALLPLINCYPLRFITVHARTARQMYSGSCNWPAFKNLQNLTSIPLVPNGDLPLSDTQPALRLPQRGNRNATWEAKGVEGGMEGASHPPSPPRCIHPTPRMIGRPFVRSLGQQKTAADFISSYAAASLEELHSPAPVLGRLKELLSYWKDLPRWKNVWSIAKLAHNLDDFLRVISLAR
jgi:tRNA-dihydrouridine synthase